MKKILYGCILVFFSQILNAQVLPSFDKITQHLSKGNKASLLIDLTQCSIDDPNEIKIHVAKWQINPQVITFNDELISVDGSKYAHGRAPLTAAGVMQRGTILVDRQGNAQIVLAFFDIETNKKIMNNVNITCHLNEGLKFFGLK
ncbi:hypothetical protein [Legionella shakespearei]|uniref:VirK protein n=1 Tax=Legionella shakespearei DSM 23087 TaxID=1122169 RepID=A0A0W0YMC1_9GAMM|nr:hypothetical protein [Legionella shakespearei]KTD57742.1 hypothetical protein Lsha_2295 [Legionella shakespearei DSM 23087]